MAREGYTTPQTDITIDHVLSLNDGGGNDDDNLVLSCRACNEARGLESQRVALSERAISRGDRRSAPWAGAVNPARVTIAQQR
jgi:5-methylcytosine-specific restriction endonuclease McrA